MSVGNIISALAVVIAAAALIRGMRSTRAKNVKTIVESSIDNALAGQDGFIQNQGRELTRQDLRLVRQEDKIEEQGKQIAQLTRDHAHCERQLYDATAQNRERDTTIGILMEKIRVLEAAK